MINHQEAPSPRLGHASAIYGDKLYIFGGHTINNMLTNQEISNELFMLDLGTMQWSRRDAPDGVSQVQPLAYTAFTEIVESDKLALFGGLTQDVTTGEFRVTSEVLFLDLPTGQW